MTAAEESVRILQAKRPSRIREQLVQGITWNVVAAVSNQGGTFVANVVLANVLGPTSFGEYAMVVSTILSASLLAQLATGYTATKYLAEFRTADKQRASRILGLCSVVSMASAALTLLVFLGGAAWLSVHILRAPQLRLPLMLGSVFLGFSVLSGFQIGALQGLESYRPLARASVAGGIAAVAFCSIFARLGGLNGAVFGLVLSGAVKWFVFNRCLRLELELQGIRFDYGGMPQEGRVLRNFALPAALTGFSMAPAPWLANVLLVREPGGFAEMGVYGAAYSLMTIVLFLPRVIDRVGMSVINHQKGLGREAGYRAAFQANVALALGFVLAGGSLVGVLGTHLLGLFGGDFAATGYRTLLVLLFATIPEGLTIVLTQILQSKERIWMMVLAVNLPRDICLALLAFLLVERGATGLATAYLLSQVVAFASILVLVLRTGLKLKEA